MTKRSPKRSSRVESKRHPKANLPENLILHGPPGTGKTYATAKQAVRLCGERVPADRDALTQTYRRLAAARRIEFVTFHQSMSYEDFVEGRQPMTGSDEDEDASSAGFRLETVPGIFRRIAKRAETSRGRLTADDAIEVAERQVFKMSIGVANNPEDAHLFEEAIEGGYALLGWDDIDWSDERYSDQQAMIDACRDMGNHPADINAGSGAVQIPFAFRNRVSKGDIVIGVEGQLTVPCDRRIYRRLRVPPPPGGDLCPSTRCALALGGPRGRTRQRDLLATIHDDVAIPAQCQ